MTRSSPFAIASVYRHYRAKPLDSQPRMPMAANIAETLKTIRREIDQTAADWGREGADITLVAVGKVFPADRVEPALRAGHRTFGENKVREALEKWPDLKARYPGVRLHLIGPLQTNKVAKALRIFDVIETVDRPKLAKTIARLGSEMNVRVPCHVQVNTGEEPRKSGVVPAEADDFIKECRHAHGLDIRGVMCIPPVDEEPSPHFALLKTIADRNRLSNCSMGMSADYKVAVQFGATHVRVGSAIFGPRPHPSANRKPADSF